MAEEEEQLGHWRYAHARATAMRERGDDARAVPSAGLTTGRPLSSLGGWLRNPACRPPSCGSSTTRTTVRSALPLSPQMENNVTIHYGSHSATTGWPCLHNNTSNSQCATCLSTRIQGPALPIPVIQRPQKLGWPRHVAPVHGETRTRTRQP